ncbi:MAG: mitochondrial fission ELM1 family protein [Hyphomicrobiales bacterium]|nr:mitochondrial fission ELM1 family protein [Hyphomicrobiales bacterium]
MFAGRRCWVLTDGKAGDEAPCLGLAQALGLKPERRVARPRALFAALAPRGPIDPAERPGVAGSPIAPPFPDVLIASGRRAVPYLRYVRRASGGRTFTIFIKDPRVSPRVADVVWAPAHDGLHGGNVVVSLVAPHLVSTDALSSARKHPDPRIAALPEPRMALLLGGDSRHHAFAQKDRRTLVGVVESMILAGASVMITSSRRTPPALIEAIKREIADTPKRAFLWTGGDDNPYIQMLAHASAIVVTADSTNMVGEACATSAPVMVYEPTGGHPRITAFINSLQRAGRVKRWLGRLESWPCAPVDETGQIAREIGLAYEKWLASARKL